MASLKEIRVRITSVTSTRQITSAMKMVSAAKLRRAQDAIIQLRPYASKLQEILSHISDSLDVTQDNVYAHKREVKRVLIVCITSNRGLCGAFNANCVKRTISLLHEKYERQFKNDCVDVIVIGKKAADLLKSKKIKIKATYHTLYDHLHFENVIPVADSIMQSFVDKTYDKIELVYNQFRNAAVQNLTAEQFLPIKVDEKVAGSSFKADYIFEPDKNYIVEVLIPKSLKIQFYKALLDSYAAEHGARMTAMHKATDNATELIRSLKLSYNKARQSSITKEILEIVGGANALRG
jgi:F-type H+-transporting ATPase subunit gamma